MLDMFVNITDVLSELLNFTDMRGVLVNIAICS